MRHMGHMPGDACGRQYSVEPAVQSYRARGFSPNREEAAVASKLVRESTATE